MGYCSLFSGEIDISPPLNADEISFLNDFCSTRRMKRLNGPLYANPGADGTGQDHAPDIVDYNAPAYGQPGLWCSYTFSENGATMSVESDDWIKFYDADAWMFYLLTKLLHGDAAQEFIDEHMTEDARLVSFTCDHVLSGSIQVQGEKSTDKWSMIVAGSQLSISRASLVWSDAEPY